MINISEIKGSGFGQEIKEDQIQEARDAGLLIHSFYRHQDDEELTHYAAAPEVVESYHKSGGLWEYVS